MIYTPAWKACFSVTARHWDLSKTKQPRYGCGYFTRTKPDMNPPETFIGYLQQLRKQNKYAQNWVMQIKRKTNRHVSTDGTSWGWYEVWPLEIIVGHWGGTQDDLRHCDIDVWNKRAAELSSLRGPTKGTSHEKCQGDAYKHDVHAPGRRH